MRYRHSITNLPFVILWYRDGVRSLEVMVESLSGGSRPEIQEEGRVIELKKQRREEYRTVLNYMQH